MTAQVLRRLRAAAAKLLRSGRESVPQLELTLPATARDVSVPSPPSGYRLRVLAADDEAALIRLLRRAGFDFTPEKLRRALSICLPGGCFIVEHVESGAIVATMMARHLASAAHPFGGRIDWLATDPDHQRRGLARICARSATRRLIEAGYEHIWVTTDDHRLGALKVFLSIGFLPAAGANAQRWNKVYRRLGLDSARASRATQ